jgi:diaminobutyrate-2-oxoglutarate transaminase
LSKAIGGAYPLSVVVYDRRFDVWPRGTHAGTFRGNQIAMVAGRTAMRVIRRDGLVQNAERTGAMLMDGLKRIAHGVDFLGDVRGHGLMIGVEVVKPCGGGGVGAPDGSTAKMIKLNCFKNGLLIETGGRNGGVLRFLPPLIVTDADINEILARFDQAVKETRYGIAEHLVALL